MYDGTERWLLGLWPDESNGGDPATTDCGVSLPLFGPGPQRLGAADAGTMSWPCAGGVHLGPAPWARSRCLLVEERARRVPTPLLTLV